jgi:hypothetical protein
MCDECDRIDLKIEHFRTLVDPAMDRFAQAMVAVLIEDLKAEKAKLHPEKDKEEK